MPETCKVILKYGKRKKQQCGRIICCYHGKKPKPKNNGVKIRFHNKENPLILKF